jgi:hypothetical protein
MTATKPTTGPSEHAERGLTIREAADATGVNMRSLRRRLIAGTIPGAYKGSDADRPGELVWRIPVEALEAVGLALVVDLTKPERKFAAPVLQASPPTAGSLIGTDRFARLRSELAEAVASAELALLRAEAEKWRAVAEERAHALERADVAIHILANNHGTAQPAAATSSPQPPPEKLEPATGGVPALIRSEAVLYASAMTARRDASSRSPWWRRRR